MLNLSAREAFNRVVKNPNPVNPDYPFLILGIRNKGNSPSNDYTVLATANESGIIGTISKVESSNLDIQLNYSIKPISTGGFGISGDILANGQINFLDNSLNVTGGWRPDATNVSFINDFIEVPNAQRIIWIGRNSNNEAIIGRGDISTGIPDWTYKISSGSSTITNFHRIIETNGHYYVTMSINLSGSTTFAVAKLQGNATSLTLLWIKNIIDGESAFTGANLTENTITNGLIFTDGRIGNPSGFGQMDGFIANTNYDLLSCATNDITSSFQLVSVSIAPSSFLVNTSADPIPNPNSMPGLILPYNEANICGIPPYDIPKSLFPIDTVEYAFGDSIEFQWQALKDYNSTYNLKILQIKQGEIPPNELPETGLFFERSGIIGTNFIYNNLLPPFDTSGLFKYVWSLETDELVNGSIVKRRSNSMDTFSAKTNNVDYKCAS
ncbi:MAG: hypothetical protein IPK46_04090 [Saprospiraceae bacterium]|nr:hypothetical protein [Saprospiraceae bacterium]